MWKIRFNVSNFQLYHSLYILTAIPSWNSGDFSQKPLWAELGCYYLVSLISWQSLGSYFSNNSVIFSHIKNCKTHFAGDSNLIWTLMRSWHNGKYNMNTAGKLFFWKSWWQKASLLQTSFQISLLLTSLFKKQNKKLFCTKTIWPTQKCVIKVAFQLLYIRSASMSEMTVTHVFCTCSVATLFCFSMHEMKKWR